MFACQPKIIYVENEEQPDSNNTQQYEPEEEISNQSSDEQNWYSVQASCEYEPVPVDNAIHIWHEFGTLDEQQAIDFSELTDHTIYVDDVEIPIKEEGFWGPYFNEEEVIFILGYWANIGYLEPGYHEIVTIATPREQVFNGWDWFGPGTDAEFFEMVCSIEVGGEDQEEALDTNEEIEQEQEWQGDEQAGEEDEEIICNRSRYVSETIPDHTVFTPGQNFQKTWTVRNDGTCAWNTSYTFKHTQGARMNDASEFNLPQVVMPGETITLTLDLKAPDQPGTYIGRWEIFADNGEVLGWYSVVIDVLGEEQDQEKEPEEGLITTFDFINEHEFTGEINCPSVFEVQVDVYGTENSVVYFDSEFRDIDGIPVEPKSMQCAINPFGLCAIDFPINITEKQSHGVVCMTQVLKSTGELGLFDCKAIGFFCK